jgi:hypothetical protein
MLPLENLDKKSFKDLLKESRKRIHSFTKEWSDENYHDPGITLLEMFTWLTEMQRYYLNRVTKNNHAKFLKLYGIEDKEQGIASTYIAIGGMNKDMTLPKGVKLFAEDQVFETEKTISLVNNTINGVVTISGNEELDCTHLNNSKDFFYYGFGERLKKKNKLFIGFAKPLEKGTKVEFFFDIGKDYPVPLKGENIYQYGIKGKWYIYTKEGKWENTPCTGDTTDLFSKTGILSILINQEMERTSIDLSVNSCFWIMFEVEEFGSHVSPKIDSIRLNVVKAKNIHEKSKVIELPLTNGQVEVEDCLSFYGKCIIQYFSDGYWTDLKDSTYTLERDMRTKKVRVKVYEEYEKMRMIAYEDHFEPYRILGKSNGLPNQVFKGRLKDIIPSSFIIQAGKKMKDQILWKDFKYVDSFVSSESKDAHFTCDFEQDLIHFGNGERGRIPFSMGDPLRIVSFATSNKERGNIKEGEINQFLYPLDDFKTLNIKSITPAEGGREKMNQIEEKKSVLQEYKEIHRAVTKEDYEYLAKNIHGIRIAMTKAIVHEENENTVVLVVVPYNGMKNPKPDEKLLKMIRKYLDEYRLITTKIEVISPEYIEVAIKCVIATDNISKFDQVKLQEKIKKYLSPVSTHEINREYEIGTPVYKSEILRIINEFEAVQYVSKLWMDANGKGVVRDKNGNILLGENSIYFCEKVEIELIDYEE